MPVAAADRAPATSAACVFPSPVVMLSIIAVAMAARRLRRHPRPEPTEREVTTAARSRPPHRRARARRPPSRPRRRSRKPKPAGRARQGLRRGLQQLRHHRPRRRGRAAQATAAGWQVVGADNWYGTIPATTVYYPPPQARPPSCWPSTSASSAPLPPSARCSPTGSRVILTGRSTERPAPTRPPDSAPSRRGAADAARRGWVGPWSSPPREGEQRYAALVRAAAETRRRPRLRRHPLADRRRPRRRPTSTPTPPRCWSPWPPRSRAIAVDHRPPGAPGPRPRRARGGRRRRSRAPARSSTSSASTATSAGARPGAASSRPRPPARPGHLRARAAAACCAGRTPPRPTSRTRAWPSPCTPAGCPTPEAAFDRLLPGCPSWPRRHDLVVEPGRNVDRGPLRAGCTRARPSRPWSRSSTPPGFLFAGDDLGDLEAFEAVERLGRRAAGDPAGLLGLRGGERAGRAVRRRRHTAPRACSTCCASSPTTPGPPRLTPEPARGWSRPSLSVSRRPLVVVEPDPVGGRAGRAARRGRVETAWSGSSRVHVSSGHDAASLALAALDQRLSVRRSRPFRGRAGCRARPRQAERRETASTPGSGHGDVTGVSTPAR